MRRGWALCVLCAAACPGPLDLSRGRAYPCSLDGGEGQCAAGWRCGLEGACHPIGVPGPYLCNGDPDCEGWHCGVQHQCYALDAGAFPCASDLDCGAGWRCGYAQVCVDASVDGLRAIDAGPILASALNPLLPQGLPGVIASSEAGLVWADDGGITYVQQTLTPDMPKGLQVPSWPVVQHLPTASPVLDLAMLDDGEVVLLRDGGAVDLLPPNKPYAPHAFNLRGDALRVAHSTLNLADRLLVLSFSPAELSWVVNGDAGGPYLVDGGPFRRLDDVTTLASSGGFAECVVSVTDNGLFLAARDAQDQFIRLLADGGAGPPSGQPVWQPLLPMLFAASADAGAPYRAVRLADSVNVGGASSSYLTFVAHPWDAGAPVLVTLQNAVACSAGGCPPCAPLTLAGECSPCPPGEAFEDFYASVAWCAGADGARAYDLAPPGVICQTPSRRTTAPPGEALPLAAVQRSRQDLRDASGVDGRARVGLHGELWRADGVSLTLDRPPTLLFASGPALAAETLAPGFELEGFFAFEPAVGLASGGSGSLPSRTYIQAIAHSSWAVDDGQLIREAADAGARVVAEFGASQQFRLEGHTAGERLVLADGRVEVLLPGFDFLAAADVTDFATQGPATLEIVLVPMPEIPVLSMVAFVPAPAPGAPILAGYLLTQGGLFAFSAQGPSSWQAEPIPVPAGDWLSVWADGARGRLGYGDGTVYALPSRTPLSSPLPMSVVAYGTLCGEIYALTFQGLYRLAPADGSPVGTWVREPAPDAVVPFAPADYGSGGALYSADGELDVFTHFGNAARLTATCP